jgi:RNA polymerase sigma-70 factor (ECF subfamily)
MRISVVMQANAFTSELIKHVPHLRRFARGLCGDPALADDLVQDCIERAISKSHLYDPERPMRAWLYAILRNLFISGLRKDVRLSVVKSVDDLIEGEGATAPVQEDSFSLADIEKALAQLPAQQREVIVMVGLEELSYREVSEVTGVPIGTVMSRLSRGRAALHTLLQKRGQNYLRRVK